LKKGKKLDKFEARSVDGIFFGYASHSRAYHVLNLETNQIVETREVTFDETQPRSQLVFECAGDDELGEEIFQEEEHELGNDEDGGVVPPAEHVPTTSTKVVDDPSPTPTTTNQDRGEATVEGEVASRREPPGDMNERTTRSRVWNNSHFDHAAFVATFEPKDIGHALSYHNWVNLMHEELEKFERNQVWELVDPPPGCKPIGTKWVWKNKEGEKGEVVRKKSRLVAQGFSQKEGIDYEETFAPVAHLEAIRILLAFLVAKGFKLHKMDLKSAFLNGVLEKEVYVRQPPGFVSEKYPHRVYKLRKALYGLKQAPRARYGRLRAFLFERGFEMGKVDRTLFLLRQGRDILIVQVYVDDIVFGGSSNSLVAWLEEDISREFEMSMMGELQFFLELPIKQSKKGTFVHQAKYTKDIVRNFKMEDSKAMTTLMSTTTAIDADEEGERVDQKEYRSLIGSLLYLTATRPDIQFSVCLCARFQASPRTLHRKAVKRIFRYLRHTPDFGLWYSASSSLALHGFSDADFVRCRLDRKSTSGTCQFLGSSLVSWSSRKQSSVAQSTTEAEYVAVASCCSQLLWITYTMSDFGEEYTNVPLQCDSTNAISIAKNPVLHSKTKHIEVRYHF
jgi:hypothetical protein